MRLNLKGIAPRAFALSVVFCSFAGTEASAEVSVNLNVNMGPPPVVVAEPPEVVLMPSYGVYFVPGVSFDVFFYNGYWWSPRGDRWYRSGAYNGPWGVVDRRYVPGPVRHVPGDYRGRYAHERHIPYGQWKKGHGRHGGGHGGERHGGGHGGKNYGGGHGGGEGHGGGHGGGERHGGGHGHGGDERGEGHGGGHGHH